MDVSRAGAGVLKMRVIEGTSCNVLHLIIQSANLRVASVHRFSISLSCGNHFMVAADHDFDIPQSHDPGVRGHVILLLLVEAVKFCWAGTESE